MSPDPSHSAHAAQRSQTQAHQLRTIGTLQSASLQVAIVGTSSQTGKRSISQKAEKKQVNRSLLARSHRRMGGRRTILMDLACRLARMEDERQFAMKFAEKAEESTAEAHAEEQADAAVGDL